MRGCRHSGVRVIVPPKAAPQPTRITCRYVKAQRIPNPPPLMEGEALVSRVLELSPVEAKFLGCVSHLITNNFKKKLKVNPLLSSFA